MHQNGKVSELHGEWSGIKQNTLCFEMTRKLIFVLSRTVKQETTVKFSVVKGIGS